MSAPQLLFYAFAFLAIFSAIAMVAFVRHVVAGVMSLVVTMISLAGIYVLLHAEFVAVVQIMVYAGAIVVIFLFVVMLLDLRDAGLDPAPRGPNVPKLVGTAGSLAIGALLVVTAPVVAVVAAAPEVLPEGFGTYHLLGLALFGEHVVAVEIVSLILLGSVVGAVVLAKRRLGR